MRFLLFLVLAGAVLPAQTPVQSAPPSASSKSNPFDDDEGVRRAGAKLFSRECAPCHGANAEGIGKALPLRQPEVYQAAPGVLSFAHLPEPQRWEIITFLRSLNAPRP
jgi:mono/diheme cytochrome c family protein